MHKAHRKKSKIAFNRGITIRFFSVLLLVSFFAGACLPLIQGSAYAASPSTNARSAVLYEAESDSMLYSDNADEQRPIASITKIMTAVVVLENCGMDDFIQMKQEWVDTEGSSSGFSADEWYTVRQMLYALMLESGNDVAVALAFHAAGGVEEFAAMMNEKAAELGMKNSSFMNPHGLTEDGHYSTARDMAMLMAYAMRNVEFATIVSTKEAKAGNVILTNSNKLLSMYPGTIGGKTGYTMAAGRTLVSCARKKGMLLICVTLDDGDDWLDHCALYDWAGDNFRFEKVISSEKVYAKIPVVSGVGKTAGVRAEREVTYLLSDSLKLEINLYLPKFVYAGVKAGESAGEARIYVNGELHDTVGLVYCESVELDKSIPLSAWEKIKWAWRMANEYSRYQPYIYY